MKMSTILNLAAIAALVSTGCVKADEMGDCLQRAQAAYAVVHAREIGTDRQKLFDYVEKNEPKEHQPIYKRIINTAYDNPKLDNNNAYSGELTLCVGQIKKPAK